MQRSDEPLPHSPFHTRMTPLLPYEAPRHSRLLSSVQWHTQESRADTCYFSVLGTFPAVTGVVGGGSGEGRKGNMLDSTIVRERGILGSSANVAQVRGVVS